MILLEVDVFDQAVSAGAMVTRPVMDTFEGRLCNGKLVDPFSHCWMVLTRK